MSAIMRLRQARNAEQIAEELEPLAVSLATLADQAQASIKALEEASLQQASAWSAQQKNAAAKVEAAAKTVEKHVQALRLTTDSLKRTVEEAQRRQFRNLAITAAASAILAAGLSTGLSRWLAPHPTIQNTVQNTLNPQEVADLLKPAIVQALKHR